MDSPRPMANDAGVAAKSWPNDWVIGVSALSLENTRAEATTFSEHRMRTAP